MSWFSAAVSIDEQVEKATSESLPRGEQDLGLNLEICDLIRSKTVQPKDAMRSLKRRLLNKNPNVQIATLSLVDICIKNGGTHFLNEIASREFMDTIVVVLKPVTGQVNPDVKEAILEHIQNWSNAFDGQIQLGYVSKIYNQLKSEGYVFPSTAKINSSFIDSSAPPEWVDSDTCMKSGEPFSFVNRKHHCRNCGGVFLQKYCNNYVPLPHFGINEPVRVCDDCRDELNSKKKSDSVRRHSVRSQTSFSAVPAAFSAPPAARGSGGGDEDSDLKRALELSLRDMGGHVPHSQPPVVTTSTQDDEIDEDMKAAIAASLKDMESKPQPSNQSDLYQMPQHAQAEQHSNVGNVQIQAQALAPQVQADEFSSLEEEILHKYVQLVENMQRAPAGTIIKDTRLQQLNDSVASLRPKLARTLGRTIDKYDQLVDMHGKLTTVVRFYDKLLEERLSYTYGKLSTSDYSANVSPQHSGSYYGYSNQPQQMSSPPPTSPQPYQPTTTTSVQPAYPEPLAPSFPPGSSEVEPPTQTTTGPTTTSEYAQVGGSQYQVQSSYYPYQQNQYSQPPFQAPPQQPIPQTSAQPNPKDDPVLIEL